MTAKRYRKKPVIIEAIQFDGTLVSAKEICQWANANLPADADRWVDYVTISGEVQDVYVHTLEGVMEIRRNDWAIKGIKGEVYPCKPNIFAETYEKVREGAS